MKAIILLMLVSSIAIAQVKTGTVNIQKVITTIKAGKKVAGTLEKFFKSKKVTLDKEQAAIKKLQESYQKQNLVLSDKAKAKKENEIRQKMNEFQQKTMGYQRELQKREVELKKPILKNLEGIIDAVSKEKGVDLTFEISSSPIVYAKNRIDITEDVIKAYDKKHK